LPGYVEREFGRSRHPASRGISASVHVRRT
jgi:hypothetical protein